MAIFQFLTIKDVHVRDKTPISRIDDYRVEIFDKLNQVKLIADKLKVDAVLCAGDFYHDPAPTKTSHETVQLAMNWQKSLPCPLVGIAGNHDLQYDNFSRLSKQPLGTLIEAGFYHLLDQKPFILEKEGVSVAVKGTSWDRNNNLVNLLQHKKENHALLITLSHALINPTGGQYFAEFCDSYQDCLKMEADVLVLGHLHLDYGVKSINNKYFVNTGALSRGSIGEDNLFRKINTCLITYDSKTKQLSFKIINLRTEPADLIFDVAVHENRKVENALMDRFIGELKTKNIVLDKENLEGSISSILEFDEIIREKALKYIREALC